MNRSHINLLRLVALTIVICITTPAAALSPPAVPANDETTELQKYAPSFDHLWLGSISVDCAHKGDYLFIDVATIDPCLLSPKLAETTVLLIRIQNEQARYTRNISNKMLLPGLDSMTLVTESYAAINPIKPYSDANTHVPLELMPLMWFDSTYDLDDLRYGAYIMKIAVFPTLEVPLELEISMPVFGCQTISLNEMPIRIVPRNRENTVLELNESRAEHRGKDTANGHYSSHIRAYFNFRNNLQKHSIHGIQFKAIFLDAFGDIIHEGNHKMDVNLKPNEISDELFYWYWDDYSQPYKNMWQAVDAQTVRINVVITKIALDDGTIIMFR